jgi:hypothetical protein
MKTFEISEKDFVRAHMLSAGRRAFIRLPVTFVALGVFMFCIAPFTDALYGWLFLGTGSMVMAFVTLFSRPIYYKRRVRAIYAEQKRLHETFAVTFDNNFVQWTSPLDTYKMTWQEAGGYKEDDQMFLLYETPGTMHIVLKSAFENAEELHMFSDKLHKSVKPLTASVK